MTITNTLNLALPIRTAYVQKPDPENPGEAITVAESVLWAYHTPIGAEAFAASYRIIAATKTAILGKLVESAPRIASLALHDAALADATEFGSKDADKALLGEIRRLTMILSPGEKGFELLPVDIAIARSIISAEEWSEVESVLVFFTCGLSMAMPSRQGTMANVLALVLGGSIVSLPPTEFAASLPKSTTAESTSAPPFSPQPFAG